MTTKSLKQATRQYPTPALEKGLDILKLFPSESGGLSKSDVARRLGRTVSEIFRNAFASRRARRHLAVARWRTLPRIRRKSELSSGWCNQYSGPRPRRSRTCHPCIERP